jgi:hypothetical protein
MILSESFIGSFGIIMHLMLVLSAACIRVFFVFKREWNETIA